MPKQSFAVYLFSVTMLCAIGVHAEPYLGGNLGGSVIASSSHANHAHQLADDIAALSNQAQRRQDSLDRLAESLSTSPSNSSYVLNSANNNPYTLAVKPIENAVMTSGYGPRRMFGRSFHKGVDFGAPTGTPIYATGAGVVTYSGWMRGYGKLVEIDHGNGYVTRYGHASRLLVEVGERVSASQHIAAVGSTGDSTGPHLHYEVMYQNQHKNPATYLALAEQVDQGIMPSRANSRFSGRAVIERAITPEELDMIQADLR
jgi:murein DD-endopeptidase MepM/ murein hydrolase activator NlpD